MVEFEYEEVVVYARRDCSDDGYERGWEFFCERRKCEQ